MPSSHRWTGWLRRQAPEPPSALPQPTAPSGARLPQFLIIGAQKAGTTWMHEMLGEHPDVFMPTPKELHFFDQRQVYDQGLEWYAGNYADAPADAILGEATPNYLWAADHRVEDWAVSISRPGGNTPSRSACTLASVLTSPCS